MNDDSTTRRQRNGRRAGAAGLLAAGVLTGGILAGTLGASAASSTAADTSVISNSTTTSSAAGSPGAMHPGGAASVRSDEKVVTGSNAATLKAAALKAVPGGTVIRIETDAGDGTYEAHMKKADGSLVTVKFGANLTVTKVETGMGSGDPAPGRPGTSG